MARLALNKSSLSREAGRLKNFVRFLPSLELKRQQLQARRTQAEAVLGGLRNELVELEKSVFDNLPMASNVDVDLSGLARVSNVRWGEENVVGVRLPVAGDVVVETRRYGFLGRPHWVDNVAALLRTALQLRVQIQVAERRFRLLDDAARKITQRVNLFEKVLIPRTRANIKRIKIYLSDAERASVVRAKISKKKQQREVTA